MQPEHLINSEHLGACSGFSVCFADVCSVIFKDDKTEKPLLAGLKTETRDNIISMYLSRIRDIFIP